jgi:hypothetical protein
LTPLDLALQYADRGWPVFPCSPANKRPLVDHGFKDATTDGARVRAWWTQHPDAMIGVPTGAAAGVWVLDVDVKKGDGHGELAALEAEHGPLPATITVRTPSGGKHYLFEFVDGVRNRGRVADNIDVRGEGGYVIAPGSVNADGVAYEWADQSPQPARAPSWLLERVIKRGSKVEALTAPARPNTRYIEAAIADELSRLVRATRGRNNALNDAAFAIGTFVGAGVISLPEAEARLYGAAVTNGYVAKDGADAAMGTIRSGLASGMTDPRAIPEAPPEPDERLVAEGAIIAEALIAEADAPKLAPHEPPVETAFDARPFIWTDPATLPRREWIYGRHYVRKYVSMTVAAGGAGKSSLAIVEALSMVKGWPLLGDSDYERPEILGARVWYYNGEDDYDELRRRIMAACIHYRIRPTDLEGRLFVNSGRDTRLVTHRMAGRDVAIVAPRVEQLKRAIVANAIDVLIVDPVVSTHRVPENDNGAINEVAEAWAQIAEECNVSVELIHHTKKVEAGRTVTATDARGGSALVAACRSVRELNHMTDEQAESAAVNAEERLTIKALTWGKTNLTLPPATPRWKRLVDVALGNWTGELAQGQDHQAVMTEWAWPTPKALVEGVDAEHLAAIKERLSGGPYSYSEGRKGADWAGFAIAEILKMPSSEPTEQKKIAAMLGAWIKSGDLEVVTRNDKLQNHKPRKFVVPK